MSTKVEAGEVKRGDSFRVWPKHIKVDPTLRGRVKSRTPEEIRELADSILEYGQRTPVEFRRLEDKTLQLVYGYTRYEAICLINKELRPENPLQLRGEVITCNEEEAFIHNIVENQHRNATSPIDDAHNQRRLREDHGKTNAEIMRLYRYKSPNKPGQLEKLLNLSKADQEKIHDGTMPMCQALDLLEIPAEERAELVDETGKVDQEKVTAKKREVRASKGKNTPLSVKHLRKFFAANKEQSLSPAVRKFCADSLDWLTGKKGDGAMENAMDRLLNAEPEYDEEKEAA